MNPFSEDKLVEQTVIKLVKKVWGDDDCHVNAYTDAEDAKLGREHRGEVVLKKYLVPALQKINPSLPAEVLDLAVEELTRNRAHLRLVDGNHEIYKLLRDGASVSVATQKGLSETERVRFFDFKNPDNNHFLCVSQLWVAGDMHTRRPDVVLFVNGIPLIMMELKASDKNLVDAYNDNIRDYKDTIPELLRYNMGIVISSGIENRVGSLTSPFEYFNEWKKSNHEEDKTKNDLKTLIEGVCDKERLLDIFENFILFDEAQGGIKKIFPRYFQYYGVNKAFEKVIVRKKNKGRLGVFWHTQGSGKSFSMVYLSQKVFRKLGNNFTFVIVTDRSDLDRQAYKNFAGVGAVYEKEVHAESIVHLHSLLAEDHRQIFTTIQKFQHIGGAISTRDDIIVMTDEAHRTQYDRMAQNMRKALPNAAFIGFTGTPLLAKGEEKTRQTFGEYVSVYNFGQSVADGATVPLYYENRVPRLQNVNERLEQDMEKVMDFYDLNTEEEEKLEKEFSTFYQLVTREDRLNVIARDIVEHFTGRGYNGKAICVSIDKKTAVRMYNNVKAEWERYLAKLRMDVARTNDERERAKIETLLEKYEKVDMAVVVSQSQNEIADLEPYEIDIKPLRERMLKENLEEFFKEPDSNLRIVFVCAMWLTGFDVPNLSTLYLDKPLRNHTLMQAIARVNRVSESKKNGLIVDYIGVFRNIERALALYANTGIKSDVIIRSKDDLVDELRAHLMKTKDFLEAEGISVIELVKAKSEEKLIMLLKYANVIVSDNNKKKIFLNLATDMYNAYQSVLPDPRAEDFYTEVTAIRVIASRVRNVGTASMDVSRVKKELEDLLDKSIQTGEYVIPQQKKLKNLSSLDVDALHKFFAKLDNKALQTESLSAELEQKIVKMMKINRNRVRFMERLNTILKEYNQGAHDIDKLFDDLVDLAKSLNEEEQRAVKENLSEEELAIFDLLLKENLNPKEQDKVRKVARELLANLKNKKLVLDWRERESTRAGVKTLIYDVLYKELPEPVYTEPDCEEKGLEIYNFIYEHYKDAEHLVYA